MGSTVDESFFDIEIDINGDLILTGYFQGAGANSLHADPNNYDNTAGIIAAATTTLTINTFF